MSNEVDIIEWLNMRWLEEDLEGGVEHPCHNSAKNLEMIDVVAKAKTFDSLKSSEICITFRPELTDNWHEYHLGCFVQSTIRKALKKCKEHARILLIGEHSGKGTWHYHGILQDIPNDYINKLKRACKRELGRTVIKQITYFNSYVKYMFKSYTGESYLSEEWRDYSYEIINID